VQERARPRHHARRQRIRHGLSRPGRDRSRKRGLLCHAAGLTTAAYSFGYVAHWSGGDPAAVKDTAERVVTTARTIVERIGVLAEPLQTPEAVAA